MNMEKLKKICVSTIIELSFLVSIATIVSLFSRFFFFADICAQFRIQYFIISFIALIIFFFRKKRTDRILIYGAFITFIINIFFIIQCISFPDRTNTYDISIGSINLLTSNKNYKKVRTEILKNEPDILIIEEIDDKWSEELYDIKLNYSFSYEVSREDNFGIAIYSKIPITGLKRLQAGLYDVPVLSAECELDGYKFEVIAAHTTPPTSGESFKNTSKMFENLSDYIKNSEHKIIISGDFNTTPFSYNYRHFVKEAKLKTAGSIFKPTWPSNNLLLLLGIPIDHIFVPNSFKIKDFKRGKNTGSDHFPIYAKISFEE